LNPHLSDHLAIHSKLSIAKARPQKVKKQYRKICGVDPIEFCNDVMASTLFSSPACNVNDLCDQYDSELSKLVDVCAPLKTRFVISRPSAPWHSEDPVPASLLRYCINDILPIIKSVVNLSFNSASMPISMKNAVLSPLLKKPSLDFEIFSNFRPVSKSFCLKLLKKLQPCM